MSGSATQKPPSSRDIPPVTLTNIPHVDPAVFQPYLKQAGSLYDAFQRAREESDDGGTNILRRPPAPSKSDEVAGLLNQGLHKRQGSASSIGRLDSTASIPGSPTETPQAKRRGSGGPSRRAPLQTTPISTIPSVYFEQDFHLENPRTFDIVSERSEIVRPAPGANGTVTTPVSSGRKALATNAILQEKLSWYMDTVEVHLISSISTASTSFFAALGSLRELHLEASDSVAKIKALREDLGKLDKDMAIGGLKVVSMRRRRENVRKLGGAVEQLQGVVEAVAHCEEQVDSGEIENALYGLTEVEKLIKGERADLERSHTETDPPHHDVALIDLRGIKALEGADEDIGYLRRRIGKGFESRFLEALLGDVRRHVDLVPSKVTFQRWDNASPRNRGSHARTPSVFPAYLQFDDLLRSALRGNLEGLARSDCIMPATIAYKEAVLREIKSLIRRHLPSSNDDDSESTMSASTQGGRAMTQQEKSSILARNLRALDAEDAEDMLKKIYSNVGEGLRRLATQVKVLLDVTSSLGSLQGSANLKSPQSPLRSSVEMPVGGALETSSNRPMIPQEDIQQALDMSSLLGQAVDIAQGQITKVLKVRSEQSIHLSLPRFLKYFHLNRLFADECEAISGQGGTEFKTIVNAHIKDFVSQFGSNERQTLLQGMDADRWDAKDFTDSDAEILTRIQEASTRDIEIWIKACTVWEEDERLTNGEQQPNGDATNGTVTNRDRVRSATIDEQKYILPESALTILSGIEGFEQLITGIPSMTQEITSSFLEYLKLFNSRSSQLILGAGATRSAGLKNITTKHLALASQALSFVTALTPYVREFIRRQPSGSNQLMTEFDKVKRLYQEHQSGINDKLVDIMSGRATTHVNAMKKIDWDDTSNTTAANPYMETLVKETTTLHKVLSKHLPEMTVRVIMEPVFASYREQWGKAFGDVEVTTVGGKERYTLFDRPYNTMIRQGLTSIIGCSRTSNSLDPASASLTALVTSGITSSNWSATKLLLRRKRHPQKAPKTQRPTKVPKLHPNPHRKTKPRTLKTDETLLCSGKFAVRVLFSFATYRKHETRLHSSVHPPPVARGRSCREAL